MSLHWKLLGIEEVLARGSSSFLSLYGFPWFTERRKYSRDFLLRFRFCSVACRRPVGLVLLEGVTDTKPGNGPQLLQISPAQMVTVSAAAAEETHPPLVQGVWGGGGDKGLDLHSGPLLASKDGAFYTHKDSSHPC